MTITVQEPELVAIAEDHGVDVVITAKWLKPWELGGWFPQYKRIHVRPGMGPINHLCTLAHEIGHAVLGHFSQPPPWLHDRQERAADEWAAKKLIPLENYEEAENLVGSHDGALAKELGVTVGYINTWRSIYERNLAS